MKSPEVSSLRHLPADSSNASGGSIKEQVYNEKLAHLESQLKQLQELNNPEYKAGVDRLRKELQERLEMIDTVRDVEKERIEQEFKKEEEMLTKELEDKKNDLLDSLMAELEEKRQQIKHEYQNMDLAGDYVEVKPSMVTRKLRRRPNEPLPRDEKRQRKSSPSVNNLLLPDSEITADLIAMGFSPAAAASRTSTDPCGDLGGSRTPSFGPAGGQSPARNNPTPGLAERLVVSAGDTDAYIESCKLFYESKCYLRGQNVYVEASDVGKVPAVIQFISSNEIGLKSVGENRRLSVNLWELRQGRALLRKRTT